MVTQPEFKEASYIITTSQTDRMDIGIVKDDGGVLQDACNTGKLSQVWNLMVTQPEFKQAWYIITTSQIDRMDIGIVKDNDGVLQDTCIAG